jgi:hypothetical protein
MRVVRVGIKGTSPYSQSRKTLTPKNDRETSDEHERRTWRERMHSMGEERGTGEVYIPPMALKNCLDDAAKSLGLTIPGKGKKGWAKVFEAGIMCVDNIPLGINAEDVIGEELFVPSDGRRGGGSRVTKVFPRIDEWGGTAVFHVLDDLITEDIFQRTIEHAGTLVGLGRFRPQNRGFYGRFDVTDIKWEKK